MPAKARVMSPQSSSQTSPLLSVKSYSTKASGTTLPCDSSRTIIPFTTISEDNDWWLFGDDNFSYDLLGLRRHQADAATTPTFKDATSETRNKCDSDENNSNSNRVFESPPQSDSFRNDLKNYNAPKYVGNFSMKVLIDSKIFGPPLKRPDCDIQNDHEEKISSVSKPSSPIRRKTPVEKHDHLMRYVRYSLHQIQQRQLRIQSE